MYLKIALNFVFIVFLVVLQFSFISAMPIFYSGINILLVAMIFVLALFGNQVAWGWALAIGLLYDLVSFSPFGVFSVSYIVAIFVVDTLQKSFFTNRSLYSFLALITFATLSYKIVLYSSISLTNLWDESSLFDYLNKSFWLSEITSVFLNICLVFITYNVVNFMSKRLKPTFLIKR